MAAAAVVFAAWEVWSITRRTEETYAETDRWWLIVMSGLVQVVSGSIYAMGAWQDELRDLLGISATGTTIIGVTHMITCCE